MTELDGRITDEALEKLRGRFGQQFPIEYPHVRFVNADSIRNIAYGIGDTNPLYTDPDHAARSRFGRLVAPPSILYGAGWGSADMRRGDGLPGVHALHSGDVWWYYRPILDGDEIHAIKSHIKADLMTGRLAGKRMVMQVKEILFYNQDDALVAKQHMPVIRMERAASRGEGKYAGVERATWKAEDIARLDGELDRESARGAKVRYWEDVSVGDELDPVVKGPLTGSDMLVWLIAAGAAYNRTGKYWLRLRRELPNIFYTDPASGVPQAVERVHWDEYMAAQIGMPGPYDYGSQRGAFATYFATNWVGDDGWVAHLDIQYRSMFFVGDFMRIRGNVTDKWRGAKSGTGFVEFSISSRNHRDEEIMPGKGVAVLPTRDGGPPVFPVDAAEGRA